LGGLADAALRTQVVIVARLLGFSRPTLWVNDVTYAPLIASIGWPSVYDVTDDWLLAPFAARELERLRRLDDLAVREANEVVVCSQALAESRGRGRKVSVIPNGVDVEHFRRPRPRPLDLPQAPVAVYVGSLHDARLDVELIMDVARTAPELRIALIGPDALGSGSREALRHLPNVHLLGPRPYEEVPAYLQNADVIVVPHRVSPFTESLDPIKAYECLALDTPVVATPVAGFREHGEDLGVVDAREFAARVQTVVSAPGRRARNLEPASWEERAAAFQSALERASQSAPGREAHGSEPRTTRGVG
jgi:glycosyltransferase involved in cell wall biosynthesis